jgi:hypothetical protein
MKMMKRDLMTLRAETFAIQAILTNVLCELKMLDPVLAEAIERGFDNAANQIENSAIETGQQASSEALIKALRIIEGLRSATFRGP